MAKTILDPKELIGFRLLSGEELSAAATVSAKLGSKVGDKRGWKPVIGDDQGGWVPDISGGDDKDGWVPGIAGDDKRSGFIGDDGWVQS